VGAGDRQDRGEDRDESEPATAGSRVVHLGTAVGCGVFAALVGSGPAALRLANVYGENRAWLLLAACATPFTTLAVLLLREAYVGLRAYMGAGRNFVRVFVSLWFGASAVWLDLLGVVLRATTHHHALAGVTFALTGVMGVLASGLLAHRIAGRIEALRSKGFVRTHALLSAWVYGLVAVLVLAAARSLHTKLAPESAAVIVDVIALGLASALAARPELRAFRTLAYLGPIAAIVLVALGVAGFSRDLGALVDLHAPAFGALLDVVGRGT
jgi:hypothetical protein